MVSNLQGGGTRYLNPERGLSNVINIIYATPDITFNIFSKIAISVLRPHIRQFTIFLISGKKMNNLCCYII